GESDYSSSDCSDTESSSVGINENGDDVEGEVELPYVQEDVHMELVDGYNNNEGNVINLDPNVQFVVNAVHDRYDNVQGIWKDTNNHPHVFEFTGREQINLQTNDPVEVFSSIFDDCLLDKIVHWTNKR
ncbi:hypothetical protein J6590_108045, partial [Homalodisca vitripennis]